jgi:hypothetical protein
VKEDAFLRHLSPVLLPPKDIFKGVHTVVEKWISNDDPSAGSPTETLLRLLLPLNNQV